MLKENMITRAEFDEANAAPVTAIGGIEYQVRAPYVAEMVRQTLFEHQEETHTRGLEVTSIDGDNSRQRALLTGSKTTTTSHMAIAGPMSTIRPPPQIQHLNGWSTGAGTDLEINSRPL